MDSVRAACAPACASHTRRTSTTQTRSYVYLSCKVGDIFFWIRNVRNLFCRHCVLPCLFFSTGAQRTTWLVVHDVTLSFKKLNFFIKTFLEEKEKKVIRGSAFLKAAVFATKWQTGVHFLCMCSESVASDQASSNIWSEISSSLCKFDKSNKSLEWLLSPAWVPAV